MADVATKTEKSDPGKISVPRPAPRDVLLAITDADGACAWTSCPKAYLSDLGSDLLRLLEEGQQRLHEQHPDSTAG